MCSLVLNDEQGLEIIGTYNNKNAATLLFDRKINLIKFNALTDDVEKLIYSTNPKYVINCIGRIKPTIDEDDSESVYQAKQINSNLPKQIEKLSETGGFKIIQIGTDCVFSGKKGLYTINDEYDASDVYGRTKSDGEIDSGKKMLLRTSIVGPEVKPGQSLLNWFLELDKDSEVDGFENHKWNGITTLAFAKIVKGIILNNIYTPKIIHLTPKDLVSKYELLSMFSSSFKREDIVINPKNADLVIDRTLLADTSIDNQAIWNIAGYDGVPTISELVLSHIVADNVFLLSLCSINFILISSCTSIASSID